MAVKEVGLGPAIDILQKLVDDSIFTLSMEDVRGAVKTIMADWSYWKDRSYEFQPVSPSDPVNGMSVFAMQFQHDDEGSAADFARVLQILEDHQNRIEHLENPTWLLPE